MSRYRLTIEIECDDVADMVIEKYLDWKADSGREGCFQDELGYMLEDPDEFNKREMKSAFESRASATISKVV